jgi:hypothetical protein
MATNSNYKTKSVGSKAKGAKADKHAPKAAGKTSCPGGYATDYGKSAGKSGPNLG